jgi:WD40 repeat protein
MAIIWDPDTGSALMRLTHGARVNSVAWSPDTTRILTAGEDNTAKVWDAQTGEELAALSTHAHYLGRADWSPDGTRIATASLDGTTRIWDAATYEEIQVLSGNSHPVEMPGIWSPDGARIATIHGDENYVTIWNANSSEALFNLPGEGRGLISSILWSPDGSRMLTIEDGNNQVNGVATIWDMATGARLHRLPGLADVRIGDWSPDGARVAVADETDLVRRSFPVGHNGHRASGLFGTRF